MRLVRGSFGTKVKQWLIAGALSVSLASQAMACAFHTYLPQETVVDWMLGSDHIVLARTDPDDPTRFAPVAAIRGSQTEVDLPFAPDPDTRARLAGNPGDAVLFARDGAYGPWRRLAYLSEDYRAVIDLVGARLDDWEAAPTFERFETFAALVDHPDDGVRVLALRELDRAPYEVLRALEFDVDVPALLAQVDRPEEADLRPVRVLLLGLSGDESAVSFLQQGLERIHEVEPPTYLGAYAAALIELAGADGSAVVEGYIADASLPVAAREQLIEALAIHGFADPQFGPALVSRVAPLFQDETPLAAAFARQFSLWGDWSFRASFRALLDAGAVRQPYDLIALNQYIAMADILAPLE